MADSFLTCGSLSENTKNKNTQAILLKNLTEKIKINTQAILVQPGQAANRTPPPRSVLIQQAGGGVSFRYSRIERIETRRAPS